jgi:hypothetical protein
MDYTGCITDCQLLVVFILVSVRDEVDRAAACVTSAALASVLFRTERAGYPDDSVIALAMTAFVHDVVFHKPPPSTLRIIQIVYGLVKPQKKRHP